MQRTHAHLFRYINTIAARALPAESYQSVHIYTPQTPETWHTHCRHIIVVCVSLSGTQLRTVCLCAERGNRVILHL